MTIDVGESRDAGVKVEYMSPPPPDYRQMLMDMYYVLRGTQVSLQNPGMIPEHRREAVLKGCLDGQINHMVEALQIREENTLDIIMQAVGIQRAVLARS